MGQAEWAQGLARSLLEPALPLRWAHTHAVAAQAGALAGVLGDEADLLAAAAWLHDVGYAPALVLTGFHPLDGARYLRDVERADIRLCRLVAYHSGALVEAEERGLNEELRREFAPERDDLCDALTYCDMTSGPGGERLTIDDRLSEILTRYDGSSAVNRSVRRSAPALRAAVTATARRLPSSG